jgi:hypothetical protein
MVDAPPIKPTHRHTPSRNHCHRHFSRQGPPQDPLTPYGTSS